MSGMNKSPITNPTTARPMPRLPLGIRFEILKLVSLPSEGTASDSGAFGSVADGFNLFALGAAVVLGAIFEGTVAAIFRSGSGPVSYTHLTLPTSDLV